MGTRELKQRILLAVKNDPQGCYEKVLGITFVKTDGRNHVANCPFHNDKTPSFKVGMAGTQYQGRGACFGCSIRGDVFELYAEQSGVKQFNVQVKNVAKILGINDTD